MSKKEDIEFLAKYQKKLQLDYALFYELSPCDFTSDDMPSKKEVEKSLVEDAQKFSRRASMPEFKNQAHRFIKCVEYLNKPDARSKRADILIARREMKAARKKAIIERVACLADENGFDGSLYRNLIPSDDPLSLHYFKQFERQIETISKIIAAIKKPVDRFMIPRDTELLTVAQTARLLGWGESVVRQRDREGLLPVPIRLGGTIQWYKVELKNWLEHRCPAREKWEKIRQ